MKGHPGIYYRIGAGGKRRYEVTYLDSDGKRRWKSVAGSLEQAETVRDDLRGRLRRGERVTADRMTFNEAADIWLAAQSHLRPRTIEAYTLALGRLRSRFGRRQLATITVDDVAQLIADMRADGYAGWTIRGTLTPLGRIFGLAVRRGWVAANPVSRLDKSERPPKTTREMRILDHHEIGAMLGVADPSYRALLATAVFTGMRFGELLALRWGDLDLREGIVRVRYQLDRKSVRVPLKSEAGRRDVKVLPALTRCCGHIGWPRPTPATATWSSPPRSADRSIAATSPGAVSTGRWRPPAWPTPTGPTSDSMTSATPAPAC